MNNVVIIKGFIYGIKKIADFIWRPRIEMQEKPFSLEKVIDKSLCDMGSGTQYGNS